MFNLRTFHMSSQDMHDHYAMIVERAKLLGYKKTDSIRMQLYHNAGYRIGVINNTEGGPLFEDLYRVVADDNFWNHGISLSNKYLIGPLDNAIKTTMGVSLAWYYHLAPACEIATLIECTALDIVLVKRNFIVTADTFSDEINYIKQYRSETLAQQRTRIREMLSPEHRYIVKEENYD